MTDGNGEAGFTGDFFDAAELTFNCLHVVFVIDKNVAHSKRNAGIAGHIMGDGVAGGHGI